MTRMRNVTSLVCLFLFVSSSLLWGQQAGAGRQSSTLLPDGRTLLLGGVDDKSHVTNRAVIVATDGTTNTLDAGMNFARVGHSATVLPDGSVFIFGGVGDDGRVVTTPERFDPAEQTFSIIPGVLAVPRAFHTATLLTDGRVLLAGGVLAEGEFPDDVQLFDYSKNIALSQHASMSFPREGHTAKLLSDGTVLVSGGTDRYGKKALVQEIFDPVTQRFRFVDGNALKADSDASEGLQIAASIPEDGANNVSIQAPIAVRFSHLMAYSTVTGSNVVLIGPDEVIVPCTITPAEGGRLLFVLPNAPLQPGTAYTVRVRSLTDQKGIPLPDTSITFNTEGEPSESDGPDWVPGPGWTTGTGGSKWQELPPLQAAPGNTALAGQVLKLDGWPLSQVTLEMNGQKTHTDSTGRFLLKGLTRGHHVLWIDATSANHDKSFYGVYEVGVTILPNKTNVLNYTIWMTRLDMAHTITIPSPTTVETVITNPSIPGLELHLPPNTTITDRNGKIVHQVNITPVPLDKPPFPLPAGVKVPIYFTVQPGGAYINVGYKGVGPKGGRLIYPNGFDLAPGTPFDFWNYDADAKGWYIYGSGKVSDDGKSVVPDPGVVIYEFTGAMVGSTSTAPSQGNPDGSGGKDGDPVMLSTGQLVYQKTDLAIPDVMPITFTRTYITNDSRSRSFGVGATDSYDFFMVGHPSPYSFQELIKPDGGRVRFDRVSPGTFYTDAVYVATSSQGDFYGAVLSWNTDPSLPGKWKLQKKDGTIFSFLDSGGVGNPFCQAPLQIKDRYGNVTKIDRDTSCRLTKVTSPNGRYINITNDSSSRITQITDNAGRTVHYTYDAAGRLASVTDVNNGITAYTYDDQNRMLTITDARQILYLTNEYDSAGRVKKQTQADGGTYLFNWTPTQNDQIHIVLSMGPTDNGDTSFVVRDSCWGDSGFKRYDPTCTEGYMPLMAQVDVTDPRGYIRRVVFGDTGYVTSDTHALGQPEQQTVTYSYYADNLLQSFTDAIGRVTSFDYDSLGNTVRVTRLDGTPNAVTSTFSYGGPFGQLSSATDPLGHTSTLGYDGQGNLTSATDPLSHSTSFAYNANGTLASLADGLNNTVQFGYFGGDLTTITDPLGNTSVRFTDSVGRVTSAIDAQGQLTLSQYNILNLLTQTTDPRGGITNFSYDANGNLVSLADAQHPLNPTTWIYDNMDRVNTRTDALLRQETYNYDQNGNLVSIKDRKGQVTSFTYDPLNRLTLVGFNTVINGDVTSYESTISYTYDAGNRMTQAVDSAGGTITEAYDNLDHLTSETTAQGSISYGYDLAGRRTSMTVAGQPQVSYNFDNANRLTQILQGTAMVAFSYDNANRRSALTSSNGVNVSYTFDSDSRVTRITYKFNANTLGDLEYSYDSLGRRTLINGSFSQTALPGAMSFATYDAANELTNWNGTALSYDLNGNMLSDGTNAFSWNARNQVASLNSVSLQYDAFGRRIQNAVGKSFLYDGANAAQELSGSTALANLLRGGVDEMFTRVDSTGSFMPLQDALGSTIALVDSSGNIVTTYAYDPFGNTSISGTSNSNAFEYTGRENEGNGLYFYRARYYSSAMGRFVSEDPLGFAGSGPNFYSYVFNSPTNLVDPSGREAATLALGGAGILAGSAALDTLLGGAVVVGDALPPVGVAGTVGWGAGRAIGHIPLGGGNTIDSNMQFIFTYFFFSHTTSIAGRPLCFAKRPTGVQGGGKDRSWQGREEQLEGIEEWANHQDPDYNPSTRKSLDELLNYWKGKSLEEGLGEGAEPEANPKPGNPEPEPGENPGY